MRFGETSGAISAARSLWSGIVSGLTAEPRCGPMPPGHLASGRSCCPPVAPELNPNEPGRSHLQYGTRANFCPHDLAELEAGVFGAAVGTQSQEALLRSFVPAPERPIRG